MTFGMEFFARATLFLGAGLGIAGLAGCNGPDEPEPEAPPTMQEIAAAASKDAAVSVVTLDREVIAGDVAHYTIVVKVGGADPGEIAIHRVVKEEKEGVPRAEAPAIVLLHGDFATFQSNFLSPGTAAGGAADHGLSAYLAAQGVDVWGVDRRWTRIAADAKDLSSVAGMTLEQAISDTGIALTFATSARTFGHAGDGKIAVGGFSHGGQIAYEVAAADSQLPAAEARVDALVPIDIYASAPKDDAARAAACASRDAELDAVKQGNFVSDNTYLPLMADLSATDPEGASPVFDGYTNHQALLDFMGQTWLLYAPTSDYHLVGGPLFMDHTTTFSWSPEARILAWLNGAPPYQATPESADLDAIWCGEGPRPVPDHLADIHVPIFFPGATGGFGDAGKETLALTGSKDVTSVVIAKLDAKERRTDFGHADLLFSDEAPDLVWAPLVTWLSAH